ncbi:MAG: Caspase domain-containing protein [Pseudanabaenaceae cyanobacterium]
MLAFWLWAGGLTPQVAARTDFLAVGGGESRASTEIALEKNIRYFQRTLQVLGYDPSQMTYLFAAGKTSEPVVRYLDEAGRERFKTAEIPFLSGRASLANISAWFRQRGDRTTPLFMYFTGHGLRNPSNLDNNTFTVWQEPAVSVQQLAGILDSMPARPPVTVMMSQCYGGSFANLIYQGGNPNGSVAMQERCVFFGTTRARVSVGCTPEVNEADYRDYSSSFWAGLSGRDRLGRPVPSADFNGDGRVSYSEAHAFAKVDNKTTDVPVATSEVWLQRQANAFQRSQILQQPIRQLLSVADPSQKYAVTGLIKELGWDQQLSFRQNRYQGDTADPVTAAFSLRLELELINIGMGRQLAGNPVLERLRRCEGRSP